MTVKSGMIEPARLLDNRTLYFYVPKGTEIVGGFTRGNNNGRTQVHNGDGTLVFTMDKVEGGEGYFRFRYLKGRMENYGHLEKAMELRFS
jgi:hypothetical protein